MNNRDPYELFDYRAKLTSRLILKFKPVLDESKYHRLLLLIKSPLEQDLVLAEQIMNELAI